MENSENIKHFQFLLYLQRQITYAIQAHDEETAEWIETIFDTYCKINGLPLDIVHVEGAIK